MNKYLTLFFALALMLTSCNGGDDTSCKGDECNEETDLITLKETGKEMHYEGTYKIEATSKHPLTFTSQDEHHATVTSDGTVTAGKIGMTNIIVNNGYDTKEFRVNVKPISTLYDEPCIEWGVKRQYVIDIFGEPDTENDTGFAYHDDNDAVPGRYYFFNLSSGKLVIASVSVNANYEADLNTYLEERYTYYSNTAVMTVYIDTASKDDATTKIIKGRNASDPTFFDIMYIPFND